ncbi:DUF4129 domain-containing transglutaminase family protein [Dactylosporangium sp. CS-047395]|uniref:DUF4129 domain-containing transglutaminase family protein n=1 Tax=Dactylosporangium sp. CS-047395 TaxID=3239936 RepID=UPI003D9241EA
MSGVRAWLGGVAVACGTSAGALWFAPVFGTRALLPALAAVVVAAALGDAVPRLAPVRPLLIVALGAVAIVAVTGVEHPLAAARDGWVRTAEATWPVRDRPDLMLFVPLLALLAAALAVELLRRSRSPLPALIPALVPLAVAQLYSPASGAAALGAALGFAAFAALTVALHSGARVAPARVALTAAVVVVAAVPLGLGVTAWSALHRAPDVVRAEPAAAPARAASPLDELPGLLAHPEQVAFRVRTEETGGRWTLAVYDGFDGDTWSSSALYQPLGGPLAADPAVTRPLRLGSARVEPVSIAGPWLPSRARPVTVAGAEVLVDPRSGTLVSGAPVAGYDLTWSAPDLRGDEDAPLDGSGTALALTNPPTAMTDFARTAVDGDPPSFRAALKLENYLRTNYKVAAGAGMPTGHGYGQLQHFLFVTKRGTSEQFAASYVVLARLLGIPARLAVGFRQPTPAGGMTAVRGADALAWPEVAVAGYGWVPLDPTGVTGANASPGPLADGGSKPPSVSAEPTLSVAPPSTPAPSAPGVPPVSASTPPLALVAGGGVAGLAVLWLAGVPGAKLVRSRRRRSGPPARAVVGAWHEARDRLDDHGVRPGAAMTIRDLAGRAGDDVAPSLLRLAEHVDRARWSGAAVTPADADSAWSETGTVSRALRGRGLRSRLRAALSPRTLRRR